MRRMRRAPRGQCKRLKARNQDSRDANVQRPRELRSGDRPKTVHTPDLLLSSDSWALTLRLFACALGQHLRCPTLTGLTLPGSLASRIRRPGHAMLYSQAALRSKIFEHDDGQLS